MIKKFKNYIFSDVDKFLLVSFFSSLPFDRVPSLNLFNINIRISVVLGLAIIFRATYLLLVRRAFFRANTLYLFMIMFIIWIAILMPASINFGYALNYFVFNLFVVLLAISISLILKKDYLKPIIIATLIIATLISAFCIYQYIGDVMGLSVNLTGLTALYTKSTFGFPRIQGFSYEPLQLASYMLFPFSIVMVLSLVKNKIMKSSVSLILLVSYSFIIFLTLSRGGIYALVLVTIIAIFSAALKKYSHLRQIAPTVMAVALGFMLSLVFVNFIKKSPSSFTNGKQGASAYVEHAMNITSDRGDTRARSRKIALDVLGSDLRTNILGIGPGQYSAYVQSRLYNAESPYLNNLTLSLYLETGIVGLLLVVIIFVGIVGASAKIALQDNDELVKLTSLIVFVYLVSQAVQYQTYSTLYIIHIWAIAGISLGIICSESKKTIYKI